jgi:hypothetical protein
MVNSDNIILLQMCIYSLEVSMMQQADLNDIYSHLTDAIHDEMKLKLKHKHIYLESSRSKSNKSRKKPYWCEALQTMWEDVCGKQRQWLRAHGGISYNEEKRVDNDI